MNRLQFFAVIPHNGRNCAVWYEIVTMREGELEARRSRFNAYSLTVKMALALCERNGIPPEERGGMMHGCLIRSPWWARQERRQCGYSPR